ncbi:hypothetical protein SH668x_001814 [Planctomicrobium sp. SH668]|uniref:hypothetical protein n=1 Tax=Planctomicrobium sp. SH668 TaxID=3448126 RepID=UPI003F5B3E4E
MADLSIQLTRKQQEILLRGLRFVRSSVALDMQNYTDAVQEHRRNQYDEIAAIESIVNEIKVVETAAV